MARLHYNGIMGTLGGSLSAGATSVTFSGALTYNGGTNVPTVSGGDYLPLSILDSSGILSEIVWLTAYTSGATSGTITRGQESTTAKSHSAGDAFTHAATTTDLLTTSDVSTIAAAAASNAALLTEYGQLAGDPKPLWKPCPARSSNLFTVARLYQGSTLGANTTSLNKTTITPTVTSTGSLNKVTSRVTLPQGDNVVGRYRLTFTLSTSIGSGGSAELIVGPRNGSFTGLGSYSDTSVIAVSSGEPNLSSYRSTFEFDYQPQDGSAGPTYLDIIMYVSGSAGTTSMTINAMTVEQIEWVTPAIRAGWDRTIASGAHMIAYQPIGAKADGVPMYARRDFGPDGLDVAYLDMTVYPENSFQTPYKSTTSSFGNYGPQHNIHVGNSGQILSVYLADGTTVELRGNTHGGEVGATGTFTNDFTLYADYQDGNGWTQITDQPWAHRCWRLKLVANTKMTRSDQGSPFLLVTTTYVLYADGTMRVDRTNTFQQAQKLAHWFYHMTSIAPAINNTSRFLGKIGTGRKVLGNVDFNDKIPAPIGGSHTTATSGGTIPAGTWSVRVTALTPYGESLPSDLNTSVTTTGTTSTVTANWSAATSPGGVAASGYRVYFGMPGYERAVGTVAAGVTTLTFTAMAAGTAAELPNKNTAWTGLMTTGSQTDHPMADWSAIYDPHTKSVYSLAVDRDAILAHTGVTGIRATLIMAVGIAKNYWHLNFTGDGGGMPYTVPNGSVFTDTLWFFAYMPADLGRFEDEQTVRAANVKNLGSLYPAA